MLAAEAAHLAKSKGGVPLIDRQSDDASNCNGKRPLPISSAPASSAAGGDGAEASDDEGPEAKRRRILEETRDIDADESDDSRADDEDGSTDDDDDDDMDEDSEDEEAELAREMARVRKGREEKQRKEEQERAAVEEETRERDIALGNPLLNKPDFNIRRRWDDDVVFKNQARGTEERGKKKEFINVSYASNLDRSLPF